MNGPLFIVEDDAFDADLIKQALRNSEAINEIVHFNSGIEFLEKMEEFIANNNSSLMPKAIFLDIKMPVISGFEILKKIKERAETKSIPVILVSSSQQDSDLEEGYRLGANSFVVKPIGFDKFFESISKLGYYWGNLNKTAGQN